MTTVTEEDTTLLGLMDDAEDNATADSVLGIGQSLLKGAALSASRNVTLEQKMALKALGAVIDNFTTQQATTAGQDAINSQQQQVTTELATASDVLKDLNLGTP